MHFYRAMLGRARYCHVKSSVRPSIRMSVTLSYCGHIGWNTWKIIPWLISVGSSFYADSIIWIYSKEDSPNFSRNKSVVMEKWLSCNIPGIIHNKQLPADRYQ